MTAPLPTPWRARFDFDAPSNTTLRCTSCPEPHDLRLTDVTVDWNNYPDGDFFGAYLECSGEHPTCSIHTTATKPWMQEMVDATRPAIDALENHHYPLHLTCGEATAIDDWLADGRARGVPTEVLDLVRGTISGRMSVTARGGAAWPQ